MRNVSRKTIGSLYAAVILACVVFVMTNREPGLGMAGIVVLALIIAGAATVALAVVLFLQRGKIGKK